MSFSAQLDHFLENCDLSRPIAVVGPTATGKTDVAWQIADWLVEHRNVAGCTLVSVDSRQVYEDIPILSGADIHPQAERREDASGKPYFLVDSHRLYGVSILKHDEPWAVGLFKSYAEPIIVASLAEKQPVILVGGTGLYHHHLFSSDPILTVPPNEKLREELSSFSVEDLQKKLATLDRLRLLGMNASDRANPRRLQRAIEVATALHSESEETDGADETLQLPKISSQYLGTTASKDVLVPRIEERVYKRLDSGAVDEVTRLLGFSQVSGQLQSTLGFAEIAAYTTGAITRDECACDWTRREWAYAKRQMTWWRQKQVEWLTN